MSVVTLRELLDSGAHFGHQTSRWNPKMKRFILTERNGIYILDLQQSLGLINEAYEFVKQTVAHGGNILFVGTKKQAQEPIAEQAARVGMPYVNHRWLGGMLTNFATVSKRVDRMKELEAIDYEDVAGSGHTKKELLLLARELRKLQSGLGGIRDMSRTPSAVWIVDTEREHLAVNEAQKLGIPVIAILDSNANPDDTTYPIPSNDDSTRSVTLLTRVIADAVAAGLAVRHGEPDQVAAQQTSLATLQSVLDAVDLAYPGGVVVELELEDDGASFEVEVVFEEKLHKLDVTPSGEITVDEIDTDDKNIALASKITVPIIDAIGTALTRYPNATFDSVELEEKDAGVVWEIEVEDEHGTEIEFEIDATNNA